MNVTFLVIAAIAAIVLIWVVVKFITGCLPKIILLGVLAAAAYFVYMYFIK